MILFQNSNFEEIDLLQVVELTKKEGSIKLPPYQRDAIWGEGRICALWDSLLRGFPLPSFLLVEGKGESREFQEHKWGRRGESIGKNISNRKYYDILDGQQRIAAINSVFTFKQDSVLRLWIDLAHNKGAHPFKFTYWIHACNKIFPFGFQKRASGEHDFALLTDNEISEIWKMLQKDERLKEKEFYEIPLDETCPYKASCPVPLDELVKFIEQPDLTKKALKDNIKRLGNEYYEKLNQKGFLKNPIEADKEVIRKVASGLQQLRECKFIFQLVRLRNDKDEEITFFERIGRGGTPITQRQLAVSKLMLELGEQGNDAVNAFNKSDELEHLLDTEDIVHALARTAYFDAQEKTPNAIKDKDKLHELSPTVLKNIQHEGSGIWNLFVDNLQKYCESGKNSPSLCQQAFENLYSNLRFREQDNPNGFSLVQIAQTEKRHGGIAPITLHPLLYWYIVHPGIKPDIKQKEDMLRWILFSNGFVSEPKNPKINKEVFKMVAQNRKVNFESILNSVFSDPEKALAKELGFSYDRPYINHNGEKLQEPIDSGSIPTPQEITKFSSHKLIFDWPGTKINGFILIWNQREAMERFYGNIKYRPALFSKGRPFDADHIVARNKFLYGNGEGIGKESIKKGIIRILENNEAIASIIRLSVDDIRTSCNLSDNCFRKVYTYSDSNYRYWPKRLNRYDSDNIVKEKFKPDNIQNGISGHPLEKAFKNVDLDSLLKFSAIPEEDWEDWAQLPPNGPWNEDLIGKFILVTLKREQFLYKNAYDFIMSYFE